MNQIDRSTGANCTLAESIYKLETRLQRRLGGHVRHLQLSLSGDGLVLRGFARTYHAKQLAQHAVMSETSLAIMANEIEVCG